MRRTYGLMIVLMLVAPGWCQLGDFNSDGLWNCQDIDALTADAAAHLNTPLYDLNQDGLVDAADGSEWLRLAGAENLDSGAAYLPGDGNLDGVVDASDHMIWNANKFTNDTGWCQGNFNYDGAVDVSDLNWWNDFKFQSSGLRIDDSIPPSPLDDQASFIYDATTGVMTLDPRDLDVFCWSVYGIEPLEFLLNGGSGEVDPTQSIWMQDFFLGHSKGYSLDLSPLAGPTPIVRFAPGLTSADFEYVTFGIPSGEMGQGGVTIVSGVLAVPEPAHLGVAWMAIGLSSLLLSRSRR